MLLFSTRDNSRLTRENLNSKKTSALNKLQNQASGEPCKSTLMLIGIDKRVKSPVTKVAVKIQTLSE